MSIRIQLGLQRGRFGLDVDLEFPAEGVTSIYGPSGSGKTTLLRAIAGLDRWPGAKVRFRDESWQDADRFVPPHLRRVAYVFQESSLFPHLDVAGNISYGASRNGNTDPSDVISLLDLHPLLHRKPQTLSGGESRRVAIARALAANPRLMLLDEPLAGLDVSRQAEIIPYLRRLRQALDVPIVHVSHSVGEVTRLADHLVLMSDGGVRDHGDAARVLTRLAHEHDDGHEPFSVIEARVEQLNEANGLAEIQFAGGTLLMADDALRKGEEVRIQVNARDVSIALEPLGVSSILNILPATISRIRDLGPARVLVSLDANGTGLVAQITRKSVGDLQLAPGMKVMAQVKSVALVR